MFKSIASPLYYATGLVLMKGVSFLMLPVVAGFLSTDDYGRLDLWLSVINFASIVIGFGLIEGLYKFARPDDTVNFNRLIASGTMLQMTLAALALLSLIPVAAWYFPQAKDETVQQAIFAAITLLTSALINIPLSWLRLKDCARQFFLLTSLKAIGQASLTWYLLKLGMGVTGVLLSAAISSASLACVLCVLQFRQVGFYWHRSTARSLFSYGLPLVFSGILLFITAGAERWILAAHVSLGALAQYAIAMQFAMMVAFLTEPLTLWWFPKRFSILAAHNGKQKTALYAQAIAQTGIWFALIIALVAPALITWLFPARYAQAIPLIPWLALGIALKQISHLFNTGCYNQESPAIVLRLNLFFAVLALGLFFIGSHFLALQGIVIAFVILYGLRALAFTYVSQTLLALPYQYSTLIHQLLGLLVFIVLNPFSHWLGFLSALAQTVLLAVWFWQAFGIKPLHIKAIWVRT